MKRLSKIGRFVAQCRKLLPAVCVAAVLAAAAPIGHGQAAPEPQAQADSSAGQAAAPSAASSAASSQTAAVMDKAIPTLKVLSAEEDLVFTVTDKNGKFITGLNLSSFGLLDDGRPPQKVIAFQQQTGLPLRVGIMLDTSSSIRQRFQFEQDAAISFLLEVLHRDDKAFVEGFDVQTDLEQGFTNNISLLDQAIRRLRPGGGTALFDALYSTCSDQMLPLHDIGPVRRAIILVSDGDDNYSHALESDAVKECQRADTIVYTISTDVSPTRDVGDKTLRDIAQKTGGQAFFPERIEDVALGFLNIEQELRSQYLLEYQPADFKQDGSFRTIYLHAIDSRYHVRAQQGYFAPKAAN